MSLNSLVSSFSFFFLSFFLAWVKVYKSLHCSFNKFNYWWNKNLYSFSLFLNTCNFPIFKNCRRKTAWVVLIFDRFSIFQISFSPFYRWVPSRSRLNSAYSSNAVFCPNSNSSSNFSNTWLHGIFEESVSQSFHFFSCQVMPLNWPRLLLFNRLQTTGCR